MTQGKGKGKGKWTRRDDEREGGRDDRRHDDRRGNSNGHQGQQGHAPYRADYDWNHKAFVPPGADASGRTQLFESTFEPGFRVPSRLRGRKMDLVEAVNDFHYAMLGDEPRNEFYLSCLKQFITPESIVLEIGTGTGLLAMLAAQCGAKRIYAIEANRDMARLAQNNIAANNLSSKITILNMLSTEVTARDLDNNRPNVILSELFGTLLLGESAHVYIRDAVKRLCSTSPSAGPNPAHGANVGVDVIPRFGAQFATLIHSPALERITSVTKWNGIELSTLNSLKDTVSVVFTKSYGFRFSTIEHEAVAPRVAVLDMDFATVDPETMPSSKRVRVKCDKSGTVHAILLTWEAYSDLEHTHTMSTEPAATKDNFPRDMQWGQALQLVEDFAQDGPQPMPFVVSEGEEIDVLVRFSSDGVLMQFELQHLPAARPAVQQ